MKPLTGKEVQELDRVLESSPDAMSLEQAHGYFTAIVTAPTAVMPSVWIKIVLGEEPPANLNRVMELLLRFYNQVVTDLYENDVAPKLPADDEGLAAWCSGYFDAAHTDPIWSADADSKGMLLPFMTLAGDFDLVGQNDVDGSVITDATKHLAEYREKLPTYIIAIYRYWMTWRKNNESPVVRAVSTKVGRNEPCTCGSGKKYKKCCGLAEN